MSISSGIYKPPLFPSLIRRISWKVPLNLTTDLYIFEMIDSWWSKFLALLIHVYRWREVLRLGTE